MLEAVVSGGPCMGGRQEQTKNFKKEKSMAEIVRADDSNDNKMDTAETYKTRYFMIEREAEHIYDEKCDNIHLP